MYKQLYFFLFIVLGVNSFLESNGQIVIGSVVGTDKIPVPFVNISIKGTYYGTVTNADGQYKLVIPTKFPDATIGFSCMGYNSKEVSLMELQESPNIKLVPAKIQLGEVIIMPDSTLRNFLRKAYEKIPENYPSEATQYTGFYREGIQTGDDTYIRLVEAITKSNKSSYKNTQSGTVQVLKSRKYIDTRNSNSFPISFYGGPHFVHELDCVKKRFDFLKPHKKYEYTYEGLTVYEGKKVHKISFKPQGSSSLLYSGVMYIHDESLSYLRFELQLTKYGLNKRFASKLENSDGLSSKAKSYLVNYDLKESTCYLKSIYENEEIINKNNVVFYSPLQYVVTDIKTKEDITIPYRNQIQVSYVPDEEASNYYESNWKDYSTLAEVHLIDTVKYKQIFNSTNTKQQKRNRLSTFIRKLDLSYKIGYQPYSITSGQYRLTFNGVSYQQNLNDVGTTMCLDMLIDYNLSHRFNVGYIVAVGLSDNNVQETHGPQISYKIPLKTMGNNLFFCPQVSYVWHNFGRSIGTQGFNEGFSFGGKDFTNNKVQALIGLKHQGMQLGSSILYQLSPVIYFDISANYYSSVSSKGVLYFREKSGCFLTRKTANEPLSDTDAKLYYNGALTENSEIDYNKWSLSVGVRIMF
ncbi:MAG: carboxypeptidase-like regulatory domain-containing protein [Marinilabiliaceae bacterium]|nr:carboxypeptidase-like regulatory domain-containing protein [Marinilabiliaceae bacterium]